MKYFIRRPVFEEHLLRNYCPGEFTIACNYVSQDSHYVSHTALIHKSNYHIFYIDTHLRRYWEI